MKPQNLPASMLTSLILVATAFSPTSAQELDVERHLAQAKSLYVEGGKTRLLIIVSPT